ncbi:Ysc84 domain-containing protein [Mycena indigotica]|uniref:Ysc84 domain-containing protein n=1 Tax=Mycena indigotica TaxID=2126181 RepID=A0A8H6SWU0_9AGAR|nr:Ysc84 domain-containing protein [Mycena indigotica]KAF7306585.1 Ysc84 domain-containing protein [Mycena indigotica]
MKKLSSPLPQPLPKECQKAAKIFNSFVDSGNNGLDGFIPRVVLEQAKGFAIFTVLKAGFLFSARAGTGIVIARLPDGTWSSPSAIGTAGLGVGSQLGAEMTDFLIVLNSRSAVKSFMASGSLSLGGNMSLAIGPLGRHGEASGSVNTSGKMAAMYSYSKTRGLFGGLSIEGSVIVERQDANVQAYGSQVTAKLLLGGAIPPPTWAEPLIKTLTSCTGMPGNREWITESSPTSAYAFATPTSEMPPSQLRKKRKDSKSDFPPTSWGEPRDGGSYFSHQVEAASLRGKPEYDSPFDPWDAAANTGSTSQFPTQFKSDFVPEKRHVRSATASQPPTVFDLFDAEPTTASPSSPFAENQPMLGHTRSMSASPYKPKSISTPFLKPQPALSRSTPPPEGVARAVALYDFQAVQPGDLSFSKGDIIVVTKRSNSTDDWWTGTLNGEKGIFPANFVDVL